MKRIEIQESEHLITVLDLIKFEQVYKKILPENYKKLLIKYNGGVEAEGDKLFDSLYSIKYGESTVENAITNLQILEKNIPDEYLPFARTAIGDEITLYLKESEDQGKIFLFRYDELKPQKIADSLEELFGVKDIDEL